MTPPGTQPLIFTLNTTNMIVHLQREHQKENLERIETEERRKRETEADTMSQVFNP